MENNFKCPICGAPGLPDYRQERVKCHVCDTDLSPYMLLQEGKSVVEKTTLLSQGVNDFKSTCSRLKLIVIIVSVFTLLFLGLSICCCYDNFNNKKKLTTAQSTIATLEAELASKVDPVAPTQDEPLNNGFTYTVRKGDSFWLISSRFFGNGAFAAKIAADNGMLCDDAIHTGDVLIIKN